MKRVRNRLKFQVEQLLMRGAHYRLLVIVALIGLVSGVAGGLVMYVDPEFNDPRVAIWWAFLRLTDPGYLGDDTGVGRRVISTAVTVLGYVIFMGALIAIMTQWLIQTMRSLESGLTPIVRNDHFLILGWTNRTPSIVRELLLSEERVRRFLRLRGARRLHVVILAEEVDVATVQELRDKLGALWKPRQITFRSGSPLHIDHLRRVDFMNAAAILLPGADFAPTGAETVDTRIVKILLSIARHGRDEKRAGFPLLVTEIFDARKLHVARSAYEGPIELLASDLFMSRLMAQNVRHRGLSYVFGELLGHDGGNEVYVRSLPEFAGQRLQDLTEAFPTAVILGVVRAHDKSFTPILNPPDGFILSAEDRIVLIARSYALSTPMADCQIQPLRRGAGVERTSEPARRRILILGWSRKVGALLQEFDSYEAERFDVDILSYLPVSEREKNLARFDLNLRQVQLTQLEGDYTAASDLKRVRPESYDNILLLGSDWLDSEGDSDARTILGYLLLIDSLPTDLPGLHLLVELMDAENVQLLHRSHGREVLVGPLILSHMLAQVSLRRELRAVFDELFGPGGAEIYFRAPSDYDVVGRPTNFREVQNLAQARGEIALGVRLAKEASSSTGGVLLNPELGQYWTLTERDELVVLTTYS